MDTIGENLNNVKELMNILEMCNKSTEKCQIHMLLEKIDEMENNYQTLLQELESAEMILNSMQLDSLLQTQAPIKANNIIPIMEATQEAAQVVNNMKEVRIHTEKMYQNLQNIGKELNAGAKLIVTEYKDIGRIVLNNVCIFLGIEEKMIYLQDDARSNEQVMKMAAEKIERSAEKLIIQEV
mgnify:CR=1 FL=1